MDVEAFLQLSPEALRERLPVLVAEWVDDALLRNTISAELTDLVASWSDSEVASIVDAVAGVGVERRLYTAHPLLRQAVRIWCGHVLAGSTLEGVAHLAEAAAEGPTAVVCNHQSYIDSNAVDTVIFGHAPEELANRFVSAAGPKVYDGLFRRLASASLNTILVPQSSTLGHTAPASGTRTGATVAPGGRAVTCGHERRLRAPHLSRGCSHSDRAHGPVSACGLSILQVAGHSHRAGVADRHRRYPRASASAGSGPAPARSGSGSPSTWRKPAVHVRR